MKHLFLILLLTTTNVFAQQLTQKDAEKRSSQVSDIKYVVDALIAKNTDSYSGKVKINFNLKYVDKLRIDFKQGQILKVEVGNKEIKDFEKAENALFIPEKYFVKGPQVVSIEFNQKFNRQGIGLHKFVDPEDKNTYFYTQFEPNDASRFIPCFDQPDLKAKFTLNITTEGSWTVVSTQKESSVVKVKNNMSTWKFPESPLMSTYLLSLHIGPYTQWSDKYKSMNLRIFARKSMAKYVDTVEWFTITKQGLKYFEDFFNYPFPFEKYDQLVVPEFNFGAMENIGAVTFSENFLSRGKKTDDQKENAANVILHEMAHMWFGNLVTMKWWNDLWLNESFATYMATKAVAEATKYKQSWKSFYLGDKAWAYYSDELSTTHPIEAEIKSADDAFNNFDGITYGKGAAVMKQLAFYIGDNAFRKALQVYFKKYAFKNAVLDDLLNEFQAQVPKETFNNNLMEWKKTWLQSKGVDTISSKFTCKDGHFDLFEVSAQFAPGSPVKDHALIGSLFKLTNNKLRLISTPQIIFNKGTASVGVTGLECPDIAFPNYLDYGYFKVNLDETSLENIKKHISKLDDSFTRLMLWNTLWQMVRDQKISIFEYLNFAEANLPLEKDFKILRVVTRQLSGGGYNGRNNVLFFHPTDSRGDIQKKSLLSRKIESLYLGRLEKSKPGSDDQKLWFENYLNVAQSPIAQQKLLDWMSGKWVISGLKADPELRWTALGKLCMKDHSRASELVNKELARDSSDRGKKSSLYCMSSFSDIANKNKWWTEITNENSSYSHSDKKSIMKGLFPDEQKQFIGSQFSTKYFDVLKDTKTERSEHFWSDFAQYAGPDSCQNEMRQKYAALIKENANLSPVVVKEIKEIIDDGERCEKIRTKASATTKNQML